MTSTFRKLLFRRRGLFGGIAAAAALTVGIPVEAAEDRHPEWELQAAELKDLARDRSLSDAEADALFRRSWEIERRIGSVAADTLCGVASQLRLVVAMNQQGELDEAALAGLRNALATVERLARRA